MPNKKINELTPRTPTLTDLIIVGDPSSGYSFKATLSVISTFVGNNIQFSSLGGISLTNPTNGQVLTYNGTNWVNQTLSVPVQSVFGRTGSVVAAEGDYNLGQLGDVTISTPTSGQVLKYNGTSWVNDSDTDTGITSLNGLTATTQTFATGTSGTDFNISSATSTHTFNLPTASSTNRGALSSADWLTFNAKQSAISLTTTGSSGAATFVSNTLNIPEYTLTGLGGVPTSRTLTINGTAYDLSADRSWTISAGVTGSGTTNYISKWTGSTALGNSIISESGNTIGIDGVGGNAILIIRSPSGQFYPTLRFTGNGSLNADIYSYDRRLYTSALNGHYFTNGTTTQMLLTASGRLLLGTTTESTFELDVVGDIRSTLDANINGLTVGKGGGSVANNTAIGSLALNSNTTGDYNTAVGRQSLNSNTTGIGNIALGWATGVYQQTGNYNLYLGYGAGYYDRGSNNIFLGFQAGYHTTFSTSSNNIGIGYYALNNVDAGNNLAFGNQASRGITTGVYNTILGTNANTSNGITTGSYNTIIGSQITGLSSSLSNHTILADGQGNMRLVAFNDGNVYIGGSTTLPTNSGYKLDVNGTVRVSDVFHANGSAIGFGAVRVKETSGGYGVVVHPNASTSTYTQYNASSITFWNGTVASTISQISGSLYNDVNSANAIYNRFSNNHVFTITSGGASVGASSLNASAVLEATSTTKGFLPPRMTGAQAEAIGTPAAGLLVYANNGNGTTITSTGWWGYNGTTWVKLN